MENKNEKRSGNLALGVAGPCTIVLVIAKAFGLANFSWWFCLAPYAVLAAFAIALVAFGLIVPLIATIVGLFSRK